MLGSAALRTSLAAIACTVALGGCGIAAGERARPEPAQQAPNVVVVMTDDQALDTMRALPRAKRLLGGGGTTFSEALVSFPLCCPSRATFLTGQYAHNHGVRDNQEPAGGLGALDQKETLPVWLQDAGYVTGFVGKYLNGYGKDENGGERFVPPGWDRWVAAQGSRKTAAYDYELNEDGELVEYGSSRRDYKTDVMAAKARGFIREAAEGERPLFLWVATSAPHTDNNQPASARRNPLPARRDRGSFSDATLPRGPAFDEADVADKPAFVRGLGRIQPRTQRGMRTLFVSQLESLLAVDRLVADLARELLRSGELENTIFIFTSDNGYLRGQHRLDSGKSKAYDESVRVPLMVRGPGFEPGSMVSTPVANVDLARTIVDAAGARPGIELDGQDLRSAGSRANREILLEVFERREDRFVAVRDRRWLYVEREGGRNELYDRRADPAELDNLAFSPLHRATRERLAARLDELEGCRGEACR